MRDKNVLDLAAPVKSPHGNNGAIMEAKPLTANTETPPSDLQTMTDPNLVTWDNPTDNSNPQSWSQQHKWGATLVVSMFSIIAPISSSMVAPSLDNISRDFHITSSVETQLVLSIYVLAWGFGPLLLGPLSEMYGRVRVLQLSNCMYLVFNIACGIAQSKEQIIAFRFLSGFGGSAPLALGDGVLGDIWPPEQRGKAISIYSLAPLLGPALGPIAGGFITQSTTWRWSFYSTSIVDGIVGFLGIFLLQETYAPYLLHKRAERLRKETGNQALYSVSEGPEKTLGALLKISLSRPLILLSTQVIIQVLSIYMAFIYGVSYLVLSTFPTLWSAVYHENLGIGSLNYISVALGFLIGTQIGAPLNDKIYKALRTRNHDQPPVPEYRIPLMVPSTIFVPIGFLIYGWTAQYHTHWIFPNIGTTIFTAGVIVNFQCIQTYVIDAYPLYTASAMSAASLLRALAGFGFPLFGPAMYTRLGYGWGGTLLAAVAALLGCPGPILLWKYGARLRNRSPFAAGNFVDAGSSL